MNTPTKAKPILRWPGGKSRMLKKLLPLIPQHVCYCEPFIGGGAMLFAKDRSKVEVINDVNGDLIALYLNVQKHLPEVLRQIESFVSSRELFHLFGAQPGLTEIERAARFLFRNRISFSGGMRTFGVAKTAGGGVAFNRERVTELLQAAHHRLNAVVIEKLPYDRCFKNYDSKDTFFFIDPPYINAPTGAYEGWTEQHAVELKRHLRRLQGNWIVTLNDSPFTRDLFKDCKIDSFTSRSGCTNNRTSAKTFSEIIVTP